MWLGVKGREVCPQPDPGHVSVCSRPRWGHVPWDHFSLYDFWPPHCQIYIVKEYLTTFPCSTIFRSSQLSIKLQNQVPMLSNISILRVLLSHVDQLSQIYKCQTGQLPDFWIYFAPCPFCILRWKYFFHLRDASPALNPFLSSSTILSQSPHTPSL